MYSNQFKNYLKNTLEDIKASGLYKDERIITSPQGPEITLNTGQKVLNFCANNYLGLADNPDVIDASKKMMDIRGYGMASVRFICGTQDKHKELEAKLADFYQTDDTILYAAAFDANGGVFEPLFGPEDAIISDELNHASIIDGVRLTKTARYRYKNNDMADLEARLKEANEAGHRFKIIVTDGVFFKNACLIGMSATILDGAVIGEESIVGAGSLVTKNKKFPPRSLIMGSPAKVVRQLTDEEVAGIYANAKNYVDYKNDYINTIQ
jgi:7-keto-8-aminopelargonate synthetase-like enzyme